MDADTVIKNATIVTHDRTFKGGVAIRKGKISAIAEEARRTAAGQKRRRRCRQASDSRLGRRAYASALSA